MTLRLVIKTDANLSLSQKLQIVLKKKVNPHLEHVVGKVPLAKRFLNPKILVNI